MGTMVCSKCGKTGIYWKNLGNPRVLSPPYTYCPHCGGRNCQQIEEAYWEDEEDRLKLLRRR